MKLIDYQKKLFSLSFINPVKNDSNQTTNVCQEIKVAIADDHKIFRDGIRMALRDKEYLKILWEAEDGKDLMHKLQLKTARCYIDGYPDARSGWHQCHQPDPERI